jgi:anti-sigma factor RsiW
VPFPGSSPRPTIRWYQLVELVTDYLEGVLDAATVAEFDAHLALCPGCAEYLAQIRETASILGRVSFDGLSDPARARLLAAFGELHSRRSSISGV